MKKKKENILLEKLKKHKITKNKLKLKLMQICLYERVVFIFLFGNYIDNVFPFVFVRCHCRSVFRSSGYRFFNSFFLLDTKNMHNLWILWTVSTNTIVYEATILW